MGSFGEKLRKEREKRKITLDDISLSTKIGIRLLHALEEEDFEQLPGGIFNKGFVRAYARHVGIDEEEAVADYLEAAGETQLARTNALLPEIHATVERAEPPQHEDNTGIARIPWGILAIILLLLAVAFALWSYYARNAQAERPRTSGPQASATVASRAGTSRPAAAGVAAEAEPVLAAAPESGAGTGRTRRTDTTSGPTTPATAGRPTGDSVPATASPSLPNAQAALAPGGLTLLIRASEDSWLSISADGRAATEETLVAPGEKSITASRGVLVKAGNVGGLTFVLNGKRLPPQGDYGEVKTLVFTSEGVRVAPPIAAKPSPIN